MSLCTTAVHNTVLIIFVLNDHHCSDAVYWREERFQEVDRTVNDRHKHSAAIV